jgi:hypothetical protein
METKKQYGESMKQTSFLWKDKKGWQTFSQTNQKKKGEDLN